MEAAKANVERHQRFWNGFVRFLTYSIIGVAVTLGLLAIFLL